MKLSYSCKLLLMSYDYSQENYCTRTAPLSYSYFSAVVQVLISNASDVPWHIVFDYSNLPTLGFLEVTRTTFKGLNICAIVVTKFSPDPNFNDMKFDGFQLKED